MIQSFFENHSERLCSENNFSDIAMANTHLAL